MATPSALLGQEISNAEKSKDEIDLQERSTKKIKGGEHDYSNHSSALKDYSDLVDLQAMEKGGGRSYRDTVTGKEMECEKETEVDGEGGSEEEEEKVAGIRVEEKEIGGYECPEFVFSKTEEKRIHRPWRRGVIVKLLGRKIGYKALETRLKQMWVRKGVISIIDLGNDYYLVAFSNSEDQYEALMNGPWFIYDHYLTVKEWCPNFHPASDTITKVAVWVRIAGLPIEFYDAKVLHCIGDRIGRTVKVDKNTLTQERGKYARLCVEVDLTKKLLAMFSIKSTKYNVEYEGLHLLCITCGKFGHYKEGCPEKPKQQDVNGTVRQNGGEGSGPTGCEDDGPWVVVQKPRRNRKGKEKETAVDRSRGKAENGSNNDDPKISGSRFISLNDEIPELNEDIPIIIGVEEGEKKQGEVEKIMATNMERNDMNEGGEKQHSKFKKGSGSARADRSSKDSQLATRGTQNFKGKRNGVLKKGVENLNGVMGENRRELLWEARLSRPKDNNGQVKIGIHNSNNMRVPEMITEGVDNGTIYLGQQVNTELGQKQINLPNSPRPPNSDGSTTMINSFPQHQSNEQTVDVDDFVDASDNGVAGDSESDMEVVTETPRLEQ
ncbi:hypothetical protein A2U01_0004722 [Trifolium medium]|uniref:CCHC-type domain-containing protein n=1 Tax=Trifolium medium TaxID=97028 RepID=A0A392MCA2_9FABA|nr:hypothetical protein [Trifolium medium]